MYICMYIFFTYCKMINIILKKNHFFIFDTKFEKKIYFSIIKKNDYLFEVKVYKDLSRYILEDG